MTESFEVTDYNQLSPLDRGERFRAACQYVIEMGLEGSEFSRLNIALKVLMEVGISSGPYELPFVVMSLARDTYLAGHNPTEFIGPREHGY